MTFNTMHLSVSINCSADEAYQFVSNPRNLPAWASGLAGGIEQIDGKWVAESPMGRVTITFAPENSFGVLDHEVATESGERFANPMRVIPNDDGCELIFTLFRRTAMNDAEFSEDARTITKDLHKLRHLLERQAPAS
ncbi:MAG: SRPBCC family protein [Janthinobacterium lividum]